MSDELPAPPKALNEVKAAAITTAQVVRNPMAFLNWKAWFLGLYSSSFTAFAGAITTWLSTNGIEGSFQSVPVIGEWVKGVGMDWKTAIAQALIHAIYAAAKYISKTKGLPPGVSATPFSLKSNQNEEQNPSAV